MTPFVLIRKTIQDATVRWELTKEGFEDPNSDIVLINNEVTGQALHYNDREYHVLRTQRSATNWGTLDKIMVVYTKLEEYINP